MEESTGTLESSRASRVNPSWDVQTSLVYMLEAINGLDKRLTAIIEERDRRYNEKTTEMDRRYQERFEASKIALDAAFIAQKEAVNTALIAAEKAVNAALAASEKAVLKAEVASERRFEGVNEFRQSLNDLSRLQMPRTEAEALAKAQDAKLDAAVGTINDRLLNIEKKGDVQEGRGSGFQSVWGVAVAVLAILISLASLAFVAFKATQ